MPILLGVQYDNTEHRFVKQLVIKVKTDSSDLAEASGSKAGDRKWLVPDSASSVFVSIKLPSPQGSGKQLIDSLQTFAVLAGPPSKLVPQGGTPTSDWVPRLTHAAGMGVEKKAGGAFQLKLDVAFLDVTSYVKSKGGGYTPQHGSRFAILEYTGKNGPPCWAVLLPPAIPAAGGPEEPGALLFLRPTGKVAYHNSDDVGPAITGMFERYVGPQTSVPPSGLGGSGSFPNYQNCGWERQLVASRKQVILVFPLPMGSDHGDATGPRATGLVRSVLTALWDSRQIGLGHPVRPGRMALGGYSHGGKMAMMTLQHKSNHADLTEAYLFDPASFPALKGNVTAWFGAGKILRMIAGGYQQGRMLTFLPTLSGGTATVWPDNRDFWFTAKEYQDGLSRTGGPIEHFTSVGSTPPADSPSAYSGVFLDSYSIDSANPANTKLKLSAKPGASKLVHDFRGVAHEEAAAVLRWAVIDKYASGKPVTAGNFATAMTFITVHDDNAGEPNRQSATRHEWTVFGGMVSGGAYKGFLERCLDGSGFKNGP